MFYIKLWDVMIPRGTSNPPPRRVVDLSLQLKSTLDNLLHGGQLQGWGSPFFFISRSKIINRGNPLCRLIDGSSDLYRFATVHVDTAPG